jgi:hypothetical protein
MASVAEKVLDMASVAETEHPSPSCLGARCVSEPAAGPCVGPDDSQVPYLIPVLKSPSHPFRDLVSCLFFRFTVKQLFLFL